MRIRRLPQELVDQIAAGEVVERPASVVKELLENSLDAGARDIQVSVEGGGRRLLAVHDDGAGIPEEDLLLAVQSHATSKIREAEDLVSVGSYGFRGEALASIGAISHLTITSRPKDQPVGSSLVVKGGVAGEPRPEARAPGTSIEARDLFYNTPARRKFLKTDATETGHVVEAVLRIALANPRVAFRLETGGRRSLALAADQDLRERIGRGYGRALAASLLPVRAEAPGLRLEGYLAPPDQARARTQLQYLAINGRFVRDRTVQGAVRRAYHDFLADSLRPVYFLFLTIDPHEVDCNVHPTKVEVRLRNSSDVFRLVAGAVDRTLREADLAPRFRSASATPLAPPAPSGPGTPAAGASFPGRPTSAAGPAPLFMGAAPARDQVAEGTGSAGTMAAAAAWAPRLRLKPGRYVQVLDTYLVTGTEDGLLVMDQHALHERVLYRHIREQWRNQSVARQDLLTPLRVELSHQDVLLLEDSAEVLEQIGLRVAPFGPTEVAVSSLPAILSGRDPSGLLTRVVGFLRGERPDGRLDDFVDRLLFTMACHRAVRAGDPLNDEQIQGLLEEAERIEHAHTCPHGRPTRVVIPLAELEHLFKRRGF